MPSILAVIAACTFLPTIAFALMWGRISGDMSPTFVVVKQIAIEFLRASACGIFAVGVVIGVFVAFIVTVHTRMNMHKKKDSEAQRKSNRLKKLEKIPAWIRILAVGTFAALELGVGIVLLRWYYEGAIDNVTGDPIRSVACVELGSVIPGLVTEAWKAIRGKKNKGETAAAANVGSGSIRLEGPEEPVV